MKVREIIHELTVPPRIEILEVLRNKYLNLSLIYNELKNKELDVSLSTLSRHVRTLHKLGLIKKVGRKYTMSGTGMLLYDLIHQLDDICLWDEICESAEFISSIPNELRLGLSKLKSAEIERDIYTAVFKVFKAAENAKSWGKYIDRIIHLDIFKVMIQKNLDGVTKKVISSRDTVDRKVSMILSVIEDLKLDEDEMEVVKSKCEIRILDLPIQLGVVDGGIAFFQILKVYRCVPAYVAPVYISTDEECVKWANNLFEHFWQKAERFDLAKHIDSINPNK
ncbi:hypothetical protein DRP05_01790 [Archaeoglobales archaeon]|nr:MAG: hypothetical protein DRP05_01790 [Archaeoglobales archaeon]